MFRLADVKIRIDNEVTQLKRRAIQGERVVYVFVHNNIEYGLTREQLLKSSDWTVKGNVIVSEGVDPGHQIVERNAPLTRGGSPKSLGEVLASFGKKQ